MQNMVFQFSWPSGGCNEDGVTHDLLVDVKVVMYVQEDLSIFIEQVTF